MASPSRSGSVANTSFDADWRAAAMASTLGAARAAVAHVMAKSASTSTDPGRGERSRMWP